MKCKKCGSENIMVQVVQETKLVNHHHNILWWIFVSWWWLPIKWVVITIPALIAKLLFHRKEIKQRNPTGLPSKTLSRSVQTLHPTDLKIRNTRSSSQRKYGSLLKPYATSFDFSKYPDTYVVVDLETTGLDVNTCEIIEIGAVKVVNGEAIDTFSALVKPSSPIPSDATSINHITNRMVKDSPKLKTVIPEFIEFVCDMPLVGHNAFNYDAKVLEQQFSRYKYSTEFIWFDTLTFAKNFLTPPYKLDDIAQRLSVRKHGNAHRALADCYTTYAVYEDMKKLARKITTNEKCIIKTTRKGVTSNQLDGLVFCITGEPLTIERNELIKRLIENGAMMAERVTLKTTHLVNCSDERTTKVKTAEKYAERTGIKIISEKEVLNMLVEGE